MAKKVKRVKKVKVETCIKCDSEDTSTNDEGWNVCNDCGAEWMGEGSIKVTTEKSEKKEKETKSGADAIAEAEAEEKEVVEEKEVAEEEEVKEKKPKKIAKKKKAVQKKKAKKETKKPVAKKKEKEESNGRNKPGKFRIEGTVNGKKIKINSVKQFCDSALEKAGLSRSDINTHSCCDLILKGKIIRKGTEIKMSLRKPKLKIYRGDELWGERDS